jgi:ribosome-associated translation inhibitor RaiA
MRTPVQITFHHLAPTPALQAEVRKRTDDLDTFFDGIVSCKVLIDAPHRHQHKGRLYRVRIEIGVPGDRLVFGRSPNEHVTHADPYVAVREAFRAARRRLEYYRQPLRGGQTLRNVLVPREADQTWIG